MQDGSLPQDNLAARAAFLLGADSRTALAVWRQRHPDRAIATALEKLQTQRRGGRLIHDPAGYVGRELACRNHQLTVIREHCALLGRRLGLSSTT